MNFFISFNIILITSFIFFTKIIIEENFSILNCAKLIFYLIVFMVSLGFLIEAKMEGIILKITLLEKFKFI